MVFFFFLLSYMYVILEVRTESDSFDASPLDMALSDCLCFAWYDEIERI